MSNPLLDLVSSHLDAGTIAQIARQIGATPQATAKATSAAVPVLVGALNQQAASPQGAQALLGALDRDHDGSILDDLGSLLGGALGSGGVGGGAPKALDGAGILGHILGGKRSAVESQVSQASGLDGAAIGKLLMLLAPIVMAALGKTKKNVGGGGSLIDILGNAAGQGNAGLGGMLGSMLDADGDGNPSNDLARMGSNILGGLFGKK